MTREFSLRIRIALALGAVVVLAIVGHLLIQKEIGRQAARVAALNLGGRQHMLLERASRLAALLGEPGDGPTVARLREELSDVAQELGRAHVALSIPGSVPGLPEAMPDRLEGIYFGPPAGLERRVREVVSAARAAGADEGVISDSQREQARQAVVSAESSGLAARLDEAAKILADEAGSRALEYVQWIVAGGYLLALIGIVAMVVVPATKEMESENRLLRSAERRFRTLVESSPDGIILGGPGGKIVLANPQAERLFGYGPGTLGGKSVDSLVPVQLRSRHQARRKEFFARPELRPMGTGLQLSGLRMDGSSFPVEISLSPLETDEGLMVLAAIRDVSEQRAAAEKLRNLNETLEQRVSERTVLAENRARELARSNEELQHFALIASHDLREPLRKVESFGERLAETCSGQLGTQGREYLDRMRGAVVRMQALIDGLLTYARVGTRTISMTPVDLGEVLEGVVGDLEDLIARTGARIIAGPLPVISGEPVLLRELFQNLISNSCKFRRTDVAPEISIRQEEDLGPDKTGVPEVRIVVADNGIGFDDQYKDRIFQVFQRLHGRSEYEGTGIGLAVCRRIVQRHAGSIEATGRPGQGATVTITLPRLAAMTPEASAP